MIKSLYIPDITEDRMPVVLGKLQELLRILIRLNFGMVSKHRTLVAA